MYCIHCGAFLDDDAHFCTQCGKAVEGFEPQPASGKTENATIKQGIEKVQQILAALHDNDIKASDTKGEIRCPLSDVQNGFIHLIKRGLLVWVLMLMLPLTGWAQGIHESWSDDGGVSGTVSIMFDGETPSFNREERTDKQTGEKKIIYNAY
ncbi:MAG: zinc ribbon domain-containing protein, partial [Bacteroidales bacterium]|nr:zinc ribbon domain-containing protein [Candidatus Minthousia equi]